MILDIFFLLIGTGMALFLLSALLAPLESLGWWAGWSSRRNSLERRCDQVRAQKKRQPASQSDSYVVWLAGVGDIAGDVHLPNELDFLNRLTSLVPHARITGDVFPYSVTNNPLTGQRPLAWIWSHIKTMISTNPQHILIFMVHVRNVLQVAVSADSRYGPIYNIGVAEAILEELLNQGYNLEDPKPITLIGSSGGAQVAIGATTYLSAVLRVPVSVISIGGVMGSDPGFRAVTRFYHLYSEKDIVEKLGRVIFPGRWTVMKHSDWNRALASGKIKSICVGQMNHMGDSGYFGSNNVAKITELIAQLIQGMH